MYALPAPAPAPSPIINYLRAEPVLSVLPSPYLYTESLPSPSMTPSMTMQNTKVFHLRHTITELISENGVNIHDVINYELYKVSTIIFAALTVSVIVMFMLNYVIHKHKMTLMYPDLDKLYKERANKVKAKAKEKQSPYIEPMPDSPILPRSLCLDSVEKGQNVLFKYNGPYRRNINTTVDAFVPKRCEEYPQITILVE